MRKRYYTIERSYYVAGLGWFTLPKGFGVSVDSIVYVNPLWCYGEKGNGV